MSENYTGQTTRWARDEKTAITLICKNKPDKNNRCLTKKGASIKILTINEI